MEDTQQIAISFTFNNKSSSDILVNTFEPNETRHERAFLSKRFEHGNNVDRTINNLYFIAVPPWDLVNDIRILYNEYLSTVYPIFSI
jgi:hypothetical protein